MQRARWISSFLLLALLLAACGQAASQGGDGSDLSTNEDGYVDISVDQLAAMMEGEDFTLVNVHIPYEGELPGTDLFIPFDEIQDHLDELPAKEAAIVLYCRSGSMSTTAARVLVEQGYTNVLELDGGFNTWKAESLEFLDKQ